MVFTMCSPSRVVARLSKVLEYGLILTSLETIGSAAYSTYLENLPAMPVRTTSLTAALVTTARVNIVMSTSEPLGTGTLSAKPVILSLRCGIICSSTRSAFVSVGIMFCGGGLGGAQTARGPVRQPLIVCVSVHGSEEHALDAEGAVDNGDDRSCAMGSNRAVGDDAVLGLELLVVDAHHHG